jgi:hypothetical protein
MTDLWSSGDVQNVLDLVGRSGPADLEFAGGLAAVRDLACSMAPQASHYWRVGDLATAGAQLCRLRVATIGRAALPFVVAWWSVLAALGWPSGPAALLRGGAR